jgi:predicted nucleic acid-binding protein
MGKVGVLSRILGANGADAIITGDLDLLALDTFREIPIITPATFGRARVPSRRR